VIRARKLGGMAPVRGEGRWMAVTGIDHVSLYQTRITATGTAEATATGTGDSQDSRDSPRMISRLTDVDHRFSGCTGVAFAESSRTLCVADHCGIWILPLNPLKTR
jgi:hypothetical protein